MEDVIDIGKEMNTNGNWEENHVHLLEDADDFAAEGRLGWVFRGIRPDLVNPWL